ncbi:hypothetical protein NP511_02145 [Natrinema thermotolerans]|uniref:Uncharacterized protein n=1 Tax=Natrinema thermotolerans TaxID=121872 RepID=A0AAF0PBY9_9EURY|nr:hypothetical protein [Natrinema thermotolerans]WMT07811.1 hypothetical protein NP511_20860 [Natrinema thermotolerans]WMT08443.1 hypothetical protein NP511_02145 [Natrinema thermotolerans]
MGSETVSVERGPCEECAEPISVEASKCPHCDYNPSQQAYAGPLLLIMLGGVLTIFVVTAIAGIPMTLLGVGWLVWVWYSPTPSPVEESE